MVLAGAFYDQSQVFLLERNASLVLVDWFSSGRKVIITIQIYNTTCILDTLNYETIFISL